MTVGEVIREKRKELGLTQEQVARCLGVSAPAVNKWEKGGTYPDITILPALARLLNTDINTLLCFQEELSDEEIAQICNEIAKTMETDGMEAAVDTAEKMVREYPNCGKLIHMMASMVQGLLVMSGGRDREKYEGKICSWYERVLECSGDERVKSSAAYLLAGEYMRKEEYDKAQKMLDSLPEQEPDKNILSARLLLRCCWKGGCHICWETSFRHFPCSWILLSGKGIWSGRRRSHLRESGLLSYMISGDTAR